MVNKTKWLTGMQTGYVIWLLVANIAFWFSDYAKLPGTAGTIIIVNVLSMIFGLRFDLFGNRLSLLTKGFKNGLLRLITWAIAAFVNFYLIGNVIPVFVKLFGFKHVTSTWIIVFWLLTMLILFLYWRVIGTNLTKSPVLAVITALLFGLFSFAVLNFAPISLIPYELNVPAFYTLTALFGSGILMLLIQKWNGFRLPMLEWSTTASKVTGIAVVAMVILFYFDSALWLHPLSEWGFKWLYLDAAIHAGISEELIMRVVVMSILIYGFQTMKNGTAWAIALSGIMFGLMHLFNAGGIMKNLPTTIDAAGIGIFFAVVFLATRNILIVMVLHGGWDLMQQIATNSINMSLSGWQSYVVGFGVGLVSIILAVLLYQRYRETVIASTNDLINKN